jgi:hypothetical protein
MRSLIALSIGLSVVLATGATAVAQTNTTNTTNSINITKEDIKFEIFRKNDQAKWEFLSGTSLDTFFNSNACTCKSPVMVRVTLLPTAKTKAMGKRADIQLRAGDQNCVCQNSGNCAEQKCTKIGNPGELTTLINQSLEFETTVDALFDANKLSAGDALPTCERDTSLNLWLWIENRDDGDALTEVADITTTVAIDGRAPTAPTGLTARGGNDALQVSWDQVTGIDSNFQGYQVLCARDGDRQVFKSGTFKAGWDSPAATCGGTGAALTSAGSETQQVLDTLALMRGSPPAKLATLDPVYACSELMTGGTSTRIFRLQNFIPYVVGVVAIDKRRNPSPITEVVVESPTPTRDFYAGYRADGGGAEGGYCTVGRGRGGHAGLSLLVLGAAAIALARRKGRRS